LDALASRCNLDSRIDPPHWLDHAEQPDAKEFLPVTNGLLHLPTRRLFPAMPTYFGLNASDVVFDHDAPEPKQWLRFLHDLFGDDHDTITSLQEWFGSTLAPDTSQQKILLIVGPTRSGKGTIGRIQAALVGRDSVTAPTLAALSTNFGVA